MVQIQFQTYLVYIFFLYLFIDFNLFFFNNTSLFTVLNNINIFSYVFDLLNLFYFLLNNFNTLYINLILNNPFLVFFNLSYFYLFIYFILFFILFFISPFYFLFNYNNSIFLFFKKAYNFNNNLFFIVQLFPNQFNWYKPFEIEIIKNNKININLDKNLILSYYFFFKNIFFKKLYLFSFMLLQNFTKLKFLFTSRLWKPIFKKTSYFGLYNSFKDKN